MEPQSTIFILGAGSSKPYGMPLGYEINHFIVELSKSFSLNSRWKKMNPLVKKLIKIATEVKFQKGELKRFSDSLRKSNISSLK